MIDGYSKPYRLDLTYRSGGILIYVNENIPSRFLDSYIIKKDLQIIPIAINIRKQKWIVLSIYRNPKQCIKYFLAELSSIIDFYNSKFENLLVMGDFNTEADTPEFIDFLTKHNLYSHIKEKTCWKSKEGSCIDLILSNRKYSFQNAGVAETGVSDYHSLIYIMLKSKFTKLGPKKFKYRNYKNFDQVSFLYEISLALQNVTNFSDLNALFISILNKHAPLKTRFLRANSKPHMSKELRKAIMLRSQLKNKANHSRHSGDMAKYRAQRNLVVKMNELVTAMKIYIHRI